MEDLLDAMEYQVAEEQQVPALDVVLKATPARWWETHKEDHIDEGKQVIIERVTN